MSDTLQALKTEEFLESMIGVVGINHKHAPIDVREQFSFTEDETTTTLSQLTHKQEFTGGVLLSTCNRTELYYNTTSENIDTIFTALLDVLKEVKAYEGNPTEFFYHYTDHSAIRHLFRVTAGLNSMALGEDQIVRQVKEAFRISNENHFLDTGLMRLFHKAFEAGKRVRTETRINQGASSVSHVAVDLAGRIFGTSLQDKSVFLLGAGETSELALKSLVKRGSENIIIANRTFKKAEALAHTYKGQAVEIDAIATQLETCDIVLASTGSKNYLVTKTMVEDAMQKRNGKALFLVDLSVPRNIDEAITGMDNVFVYDMDNLKEEVEKNFEMRKGEVEKANIIVQEVTTDFAAWLSTLNLSPAIKTIREQFLQINKQELEGFKKRANGSFEVVNEYGKHISEKYIRLLVANLKNVTENGQNTDSLDMVTELFELNKNAN